MLSFCLSLRSSKDRGVESFTGCRLLLDDHERIYICNVSYAFFFSGIFCLFFLISLLFEVALP